MKYSNLYIILIMVFVGCKKEDHNSTDTKILPNKLNLNITNTNQDGILFLKEFYTKYYGEYSDRKGIENYVAYRVLSRIDSLTKGDNLILDYDPFISGQDWDDKVLKESLEIKALENRNTFRVSFLKFNKKDRERTIIDIMLEDKVQGKYLIKSILSDQYLNFKEKLVNYTEKSSENSDGIITKQYDYDLNGDGTNDKIILYQNDDEKGEFERNHFGLPMEIKKGLSNNTFQTWYKNDLIIPKNNFNCATEGFSTIVFKDNYFTIENQICSDYIEISSYITFKVIGQNILLHKYGETYFDKANHEKQIPSKTWEVKDFGNVNFENVTEDFLIKVSQTNPKK